MSGYVDDLVSSVSCSSIYSAYDLAVQKSLCSDATSGIFVMMVTHFVTAACLYFLLVLMSRFHGIFVSTGADSQLDDNNNNNDDDPVVVGGNDVFLFEMKQVGDNTNTNNGKGQPEQRAPSAAPKAVKDKPMHAYWEVPGYQAERNG